MCLSHCGDRHVIATPGEVAVQQSRYYRRCAGSQPRVAVQPPLGLQAIGMHDDERAGWPGVGELLDLSHLVTEGAVLRYHASGLVARHYGARNVAHPGISYLPLDRVQRRHGDCRAAGAPECEVDLSEQIVRREG